MGVNIYEFGSVNDASGTFGGAGWSADVSSSHSGGSAQKTNGNGDTFTWTSPTNCRSVYLLYAAINAGSTYTWSVDGNQAGSRNQITAAPIGTGGYYRFMVPLLRSSTDASHTIVMTNNGTGRMFVDAILSVSGSLITPSVGLFVPVGTSWTVGSGSTSTNAAWARRATNYLQQHLKRNVVLSNQGLSGDMAVANAGKASIPYRAWSQFANQPEIMVIEGGANDFTNSNTVPLPSLEYTAQLHSFMCLFEDAMDVTQCRLVITTPPWVSPAYLTNLFAPVNTWSSQMDNLEEGVILMRQAVAQFPWCILADVFAAMDYRTALLVPNSTNDLGLHPNDMGHSVIANEIVRSILNVVA